MENLKDKELAIAREIINAGLQKSAESLSFFMQEKLAFSTLDYTYKKSTNPADFTTKSGDNLHVLITEVIGELKGVCCLIFSEKEADQLRQKALPAEIMNNEALMAEMNDGILLEVDNIISASVVTQFSNILKCKVHGGVPRLKKLSVDQLNQFVKERLEQDLLIINFNTHFVSGDLNFEPQFMWLFDASFVKSIQQHASAVGSI